MKFHLFHRNLRNKILSGFFLSLVLILIVLITSFLNLRHLGKASAAILNRNYNSILAAQIMIDSIDQQNNSLLHFISGNHKLGYEQFIQNQHNFEIAFSKARNNITEIGEKEILFNLEKAYTSYLLQTEKMRDSSFKTQADNVLFFQKKVLPYSENVKIQCNRLRNLNQGAILEIRGDLKNAIEAYQTACHIDPSYEPSRKNLERITKLHRNRDIELDMSKLK